MKKGFKKKKTIKTEIVDKNQKRYNKVVYINK